MITLGQTYTDRITGYEGIATAKTEYLFGCVRVLLEPKKLTEKGKVEEGEWFDEQRLKQDSEAEVGGPGPTPSPRPVP
jgi:hypothetical protein